MALYRYEALNTAGKAVTGTADAGTPAEARANLRDMGLYTTRVELAVAPDEIGARGGVASQIGRSLGGKRLELLAGFSRHLSMLLKAGLPLAQCLEVLANQFEDKRFREVIRDIETRVREGAAFHEALAIHPKHFPDLFVCVARAGSASGNLAEVLQSIAAYYTRQKRLRDKVVSALTYPALMSTIGLMVLIFLMAYVVPKVTSVLLEQNRALPWPTEVLLFISGFFQDWWWAVLLAVAFGGWLLSAILRSDRGAFTVDKMLLSLPILGELFRKQAIARWADTMSNLLSSGLPVAQALSLVGNSMGNRVLRHEVAKLEDAVMEGSDLSLALKQSRYLPASIGFAVGVGEQSGDLSRVLSDLADGYNEELEVVSGRLADMINPVLIVFLGLIVGFIVAAILLPITDFSQVG